MTPPPAGRNPDPRATYASRLDARRAALAAITAWDDRVVAARFAIVVAGAVALWLPSLRRWFVLPLLAFLALVAVHELVIRRRRRAARSVRHHERCLARLDGKLHGNGETGERLRDPVHPCAEDLDLFGAGSLFERTSTCRTMIGEDRLAALFLAPAEASVVRARQEGVRDMEGRLDLREDLAIDGSGLRTKAGIVELAGWAAADGPPGRRPLALVAAVLTAQTVAAIVAWALDVSGTLPLLVAIAAQSAYAFACRSWVAHVLKAVEAPARELGLLAIVMARLEREPFAAPHLRQLAGSLEGEKGPASAEVARLARYVDRLEWARNPMFAPVAGILLWHLQLARLVEIWREQHGADVPRWIEASGSLEALASLGGYAFDRPSDPYPEIVERGPKLDATALAHPLLPAASRVPNDVALDPGHALLLVSGSNMSGKSTFLRAIGCNVLLAMAGAPVAAGSLTLSPLRVGATLRTMDSLQAGQSRFYAEISRIRQVLSACDGPFPVLFLLDEILHGTNSHDRRVGAEAIVRAFVERGAIGLVTTHDLALAAIADELGPKARNVHFEDRLEEGTMVFDYRLRPGVVEHSNALALMRAVGLPV